MKSQLAGSIRNLHLLVEIIFDAALYRDHRPIWQCKSTHRLAAKVQEAGVNQPRRFITERFFVTPGHTEAKPGTVAKTTGWQSKLKTTGPFLRLRLLRSQRDN